MRRAWQGRQSLRAAEHARRTETAADFFFGDSLALLRDQLERIVAADRRMRTRQPPVLITGKTGTGKSPLARWLHRHGPRAAQPPMEVNGPVVPESLAESELLGHDRGAFADAKTAWPGLFEAAHGGTLFLAEWPRLSLSLPAKALPAVEDRRIRRVGGYRPIELDVRIIPATSRDLRAAAEAGKFRADVWHRLDR